jgi:hypothetical protein
MLEGAREEGGDMCKKALEVVEEGREVGSLRLADVKGKEVDVGGGRHLVDVLGGGPSPREARAAGPS